MKLRLNISNLQKKGLIVLLIISSTLYLTFSGMVAAGEESNLEVVINPVTPKQGDTISIKVRKLAGINSMPKVFFETSKLPIFDLGDWYRTFIPLTANKKTGEYELGIFYGGKRKKLKLIVNATKYIIEEITLTKEVAALSATRIERESVGRAVSTVSDKKYWQGKFALPSLAKESTPYGVKRKINGALNEDYFHKGLDFAGNVGSIIKSPEKGKVLLAGHTSKGFVVNGNCIFIDHGHGVISAYLHLSEILVKEGSIVEKGQVIGKVGSTGIATGPHLHWGIYIFGKPVEPKLWTSTVID